MSACLRRTIAVLLVLLACSSVVAHAAAAQQQEDASARLEEARKQFEALNYEGALVELDRAIAALEPRRADRAVHQPLRAALELRARTHVGLGAADRAREDFRSLLTLAPDHRLSEGVSPRVVALFDQVRVQVLGKLALTLEPPDALVLLDGRPIDIVADPVDVASGEHTVAVTRSGYKPSTVTVSVEAGRTTDARIALERASATLTFQAQPADVEVFVNGASRGRTGDASAPFVVSDLVLGEYAIELRKPCHQTLSQRLTVEQLIDYSAGPFTLAPAVGTIQVGTSRAAQIHLDGESVGDAPRTIERVCEGVHTVEARTRLGRDIRRIELRAGDRASVTLTPRPVFALLANAGAGSSADAREAVARALGKVSNVFVYAPPADALQRAEDAERAPNGWLAFDAARKPIAPARDASAEMRRDLSARLAKALDVQGVAAIVPAASARPAPAGAPAAAAGAGAAAQAGAPAGSPGTGPAAGTVWLVLLAAGASEPDVIELPIDRPEPAIRAIDAATISTSLVRRTIGLTLVDVLHRPGPVVLEAVGAADSTATASLQPGDAVTHVNGKPVSSEQDVRREVEALGSAQTVSLRVQPRAGTARDVTMLVSREPRLVTLAADSGLANVTLLDLRTRLPESTGLDADAIRLNLAGALMRVGQWSGALDELQALRLADGPGVSNGSVQYLIGLCQDALGRSAEARQAWDAAARAPGATLSDDGPLIRELVARRIKP